jgi:phosphoenolpyruvate carboxykinase (ATP)
VPSEVLDPRSAWKDSAAFDATAKQLAGLFRENFAKFEAQASEAILVASPVA